jgi:hypothetical protein
MSVKAPASKKSRRVTRESIRRSVASSTAIETGESIQELESRLRRKSGKYQHVELAS